MVGFTLVSLVTLSVWCITVENVIFFRSSEFEGYSYLEEPQLLSVISTAADRKPGTVRSESGLKLSPMAAERALKKIKAIFEIAKEEGHDAVVLSAFGCGAFGNEFVLLVKILSFFSGNPPHHMAELFKQVINENQYQSIFKCIAFAIIDDHNAHKKHNPDGNYSPFVNVFGTECEKSIKQLK